VRGPLACYVLAPARKTITGRIGLRYTRGGFGTPFFGHDWQLRVVGEVLVVQVGTTARTAPLVTVRDAARAASVQLVADPGVGAELPILEPDRPLEIDAAACFALGEWYGFGASVETLRAQLRPLGEVSRVQLWPEHLDIAFSYPPRRARPEPGPFSGRRPTPRPVPLRRPPGGDRAARSVLECALRRPPGQRRAPDRRDQRAAAFDFLTEGLKQLLGRQITESAGSVR
jgi:hypothetical protein